MANDPDRQIRLPKRVEADDRAREVEAALAARTGLLWSGGALSTPVVALSDGLASALRSARSAGRITRGLERAEQKLDAELRGLEHADRESGATRGQRVSRLLLVATDCAERMFRRVEALQRRHGDRLLVLQLECDASAVGSLLFGAGSAAKLLLLDHKDAVADALLALAGTETTPPRP